MFIGKYNKSLIVTYMGVAFAIVGMYFAFAAEAKYSMICLVLAGVCDLFDGKIARMCKRTKDEISFGIQLDSLADTINFVAFPVVFGFSLGLNEWYHIVGYILLAMAGVQRLSHFNVLVGSKEGDAPVKFYSGLPVTSTSVTFPFLWLLSNWIGTGTYSVAYIILVYLTAFLFVLNIKIPKLKGIAYPIVGVIALVGIIALFLV